MHPARQPDRGHQHVDPDGRCCDRWPPTDRLTDAGGFRNRVRGLTRHAPDRRQVLTYAAVLGLALLGLTVADLVVLPVSVDWARDNGIAGWLTWILWAAGTVTCVDLTLIRRLWQRAVWGLYATGGAAAWMAVTGPDTWGGRKLLALLAVAFVWLLLHFAARRTWPTTRTRTTSRRTR